MKYQSIAKEAALCRKACKNSKVGDVMCFLHHGEAVEVLTEPVENRIKYILSDKPKNEQAIRLHWLRPCPFKLPTKLGEARAKWNEANAKLVEANAKWSEARAKLDEANAKWSEARAKLGEANAQWHEAGAKLVEARAKWNEANAKCKEEIDSQIKYCFPECPWDGKTLFPK